MIQAAHKSKKMVITIILLCVFVALSGYSEDVSAFDISDKIEFNRIIDPDSKLEKLATDMKFIEGPVWVPAYNCLIFSDIPADELKQWSRSGGLTTFRKPSHNSNGNIIDAEGQLITCEHSTRRITLTRKNGEIQTLVDRFEGKRFNSPNDVAVKSDGTLWFTDPPYGLKGMKEGKELETQNVFVLDPGSGSLRALVTDFTCPNGICFSPDESRLYVADSSGACAHIRVFAVKEGNTLSDGRIFCRIDKGVPDGIRCDVDGRIWSSSGDGVQIFAPDGSLIGRILVPEAAANLCFGENDGKTLFITARSSLYAIRTKTTDKRK